MALLMHRRSDGGILVHLHEIFPRIYRSEVLRLDHRGDDRQLRLSLPGHQGAPAGDRLRRLDGDRRCRRVCGGRRYVRRITLTHAGDCSRLHCCRPDHDEGLGLSCVKISRTNMNTIVTTYNN